ncbi:4149_t:CDS:2 [Gigaspora rosea]|nr:4149_t:CDS:2 [Gigaspora rosea]
MVETTRKKLFPKNDELRFCLDCGKERCSYGWSKWLEGPRWNWDEDDQGWERSGPINVALKRLDNSQNIHLDFLVQIEDHYKCLQSGYLADCFGITRDPTGCIMFVMRFYDNGNIYEFLDKVKGIITWRDIIDMLWGVASGLDKIHSEKKFHSNLHGGNLLIEDETISTDARIADVGLHGPCLRPDIDELIKDIPNLYRELMERCWDPNPSNRPTALELNNLLGKWIICICDDPNPSPISEEFFNAEERRWDLIGNQLNNNNFSKVIVHHDAVYTSRLLYFPELKNS